MTRDIGLTRLSNFTLFKFEIEIEIHIKDTKKNIKEKYFFHQIYLFLINLNFLE